ncbi:MAG: hypothetical protein K2X77_03600 [Candidatus Obscuribacterales bacterium]|jgi:hypothetical protein|nr:hypothetical protein [Candidatus Obscuribacterales bacterium]
MAEIPKEVTPSQNSVGAGTDLIFQNERLANPPKLNGDSANKIVPPYVHADTPAGVENAERNGSPRWKPAEIPQKDLAQTLKELQINLRDTQDGLKEYLAKSDPSLYDLEMSRRGYMTNPYKMLTTGAGLALLKSNPRLSALQVTGAAALQGYDDYKSLLDSTTVGGRAKYATGLLADTAIAAGSISFLLDSVPMKYKASLLVGGMVVRGALDLIPNKKN